MKLKIPLVKKIVQIFIVTGIIIAVNTSCSKSPEIVVQQMKMELPLGNQVFVEELLPGEIADTKIEHVAYAGPTTQNLQFSGENVNMFLFIKGNGILKADTASFNLVPESIAIPMTYKSIKIEVPEGEDLHLVRFTKKLTEQDIDDLKEFPAKNKYDIFFTKFEDCESYTEKIKSPNTVSRTVLPEDIIPRVALGTVDAPGPDEVGAHKHPMLDQLFLGLTDNDVVVHADGALAAFKEYSLLHIPIGSSHWVSVDENKKMYYMWMDFFLTKEGQEWLKTHKPVSTDKSNY